MVIAATLALSTMICNELVIPATFALADDRWIKISVS